MVYLYLMCSHLELPSAVSPQTAPENKASALFRGCRNIIVIHRLFRIYTHVLLEIEISANTQDLPNI